MKKIFLTLIAFSFVLFLTACGTNNNTTETVEIIVPSSGEENKENNITTTIDLKDNGEAVFNLENTSEEELLLTFASGQEVDYQLLDEEKNEVFTYSANKSFTQTIQEKNLAPNEKLEIQLDLPNELSTANIPAGTYTLVAWSSANEISDQKVEANYEWAGSEDNNSNEVNSNSTNENDQASSNVTIYQADPSVSYVEPNEATIDPNKDLVHEIFDQLETDVTLEDYRFENEDKTLVLNMSGIMEHVQGSAGESIFVGSIIHSYFDAFPTLEEIHFQEDGVNATLPHYGEVEAFTRDDVYTKPE